MGKRKIIEIDRKLCNGCGLCTTACVEGALELDTENKAVLVREIFCDGLGACLDVCPTGALKVVERESGAYDSGAAYRRALETRGPEAAGRVHGAGSPHPVPQGCPGSLAREIPPAGPEPEGAPAVSGKSRLNQWPIQLHLVSPSAPYFKGSDLLIAADCTAFALGSFHQDLLRGRKLVIACPKLDETQGYVEKLAEIIRQNGLRSLTVAIMTVPCCSGLERMVRRAVELSGETLDIRKVVIGIDGAVVQAG
ncbi:MAG: 4Fe-4S dicluster domain-containing protein [Candidatus Aminicenantales bacterium]|jgi:ferredoxin